MKKRTMNQLGLAPMRIPKRRASWIEPAPTPTSSHAPDRGAPAAVRPSHGSALADDRAVDDDSRGAERRAVGRGDEARAGEVLDLRDLRLARRRDAARERREVHVPERAIAALVR